MRMRSLTAAIVAAMLCFIASAASAQGRFDRWYVGVNWMNPANTFVMGDDNWSGHATGSLIGVNGGRGWQRGQWYAGLEGHLAGGVVETQEHGYNALNGLGGLTFKAGLVVSNQLLIYAGAGPDMAWMTTNGTSRFVSGAHVLAGVEWAFNQDWSVDLNVRRQRLGDLPNVNVNDFWLGSLAVKYTF